MPWKPTRRRWPHGIGAVEERGQHYAPLCARTTERSSNDRIPLRTRVLVWASVLAIVGVMMIVGAAVMTWMFVEALTKEP